MASEFNQEEFDEFKSSLLDFRLKLAALNQKSGGINLSNYLEKFVGIQHRINASKQKEYMNKQINLLRQGWGSLSLDRYKYKEAKDVNDVLSKLERMVN